MNSEDLALLLGLVGGGFGGYFGGKRRDERERAQKKQDREDEREFLKQIRAEEKYEAESEALKAAGRIYDDSERRGELKDPNTFYNMIFNPSESDPLYELFGGSEGYGEAIFGPTKYSDPNYRNIDNPNFVQNPEENMFNTAGILPYLAIPGFGQYTLGARLLGGIGSKAISPMMRAISRLRGGTPGRAAAPGAAATPITDPSRLLPTPYNQGGRVGLGVGGDPVDMEELIRLLEIDFDDAGGPNIGSGSSDSMRDAGFEVIRKIFKD
tara:strand:+ start:991 stop:1794 length:804 start_codon:yes stop_codon:yes gene_type:complete